MWTDTGSLHYRAPESFDGIYDSKIDIWALGIIAYELFAGQVPFKHRQHLKTIEKIRSQEINFETLKISEENKNVIKAMLERNPETRATSYEASYEK